jgi:two-component sensor histidine kinase
LGETVQGLIRILLAPYLQEGSERFSISGDDVAVGPTSATALALVLHEQATNAVKYGTLSTEVGHVAISGRSVSKAYHITWEERGGPPLNGPPERKGFGTQMAARSVAGQLGGSLDYHWAPEGLRLRVTVPEANLLL